MILACAASLLVGLVAGYAGGRARPRERLSDWATDQIDTWDTPLRQALLLTVLFATDTRRTVRAWRDEHPRKEPS